MSDDEQGSRFKKIIEILDNQTPIEKLATELDGARIELAYDAYFLGNEYLSRAEPTKAHYWYQIAVKYGVADAKDNLELSLRLVGMAFNFHVHWSDDDNEYVATCDEYPSMSWLATDEHEALRGLAMALEEARKDERL